MIDNDQIINAYIRRTPKLKWELINRTEKGVQLRKIKRPKMIGFWVGLILLPFWGIGFILWILVLLDYALQREKIIFVTIDQMIEQLKVAK
jgi:hypothetical protein